MDIIVLDKNFVKVHVIDDFESLIWTERYYECGDFELYLSSNSSILGIIEQDYYLVCKDSNQVMIVEEIQIDTQVETGSHIIISGRSLESILDRRIIWNQTVLSGSLQNGIKKLINENVISPSIAERAISNFIFEDSTDESITSLQIQAQFTGDNLYDAIISICKVFEIGFKVELNSENQFVFSLYKGLDRSFDQTALPRVIFSPKFDNLISSNYLESQKTLKNVTLVAGEDSNQNRRTRIVGEASDLTRRELYTDARDIQSETQQGAIPEAEYNAQLDQRGAEKLAENQTTITFEGQVESTQTFVYRRDFFIGDIVQIANEYGIQQKVRVIETVRSEDTSGYEMYPTFSVVE